MATEDAFEGMELEPIESRARNPIATEREQSIQKQVALKCAVELVMAIAGKPNPMVDASISADEFVLSIYRKFRDALNE